MVTHMLSFLVGCVWLRSGAAVLLRGQPLYSLVVFCVSCAVLAVLFFFTLTEPGGERVWWTALKNHQLHALLSSHKANIPFSFYPVSVDYVSLISLNP